jgi:hypothetical protein
LIGKAAESTVVLMLSYRMCCPFSTRFAVMNSAYLSYDGSHCIPDGFWWSLAWTN